MGIGETARLALLWRGDRQARREATPDNNRLSRVFEALAALGIDAEPAVYADDMVSEVREQLLKLDGVLVWVDPISDGQDRTTLDAMLRDVASRGVWVSAHPDVILKMGAKEVLHRTRHLGWGTDTHLYRAAPSFPRRVSAAASDRPAPRVLKQNRGNGGQGVWKVELDFADCLRGRDRSRAAGDAGQRAGRPVARRFHATLRERISRPKAASSISRSSRGCPTA